MIIAIFKSLSPKLAIYLASIIVGRPDIADDLISICHRESRCKPIQAHAIDAHISNREWFGQVRWKHLNPSCQKRKAEGGWATHGILGLSAGAHWQYLPKCYQPTVLDNPFVSAIIGARKYVARCWQENRRRGWCHVDKAARKNNLKSPKIKRKIKIKRPTDWYQFFTKNPW